MIFHADLPGLPVAGQHEVAEDVSPDKSLDPVGLQLGALNLRIDEDPVLHRTRDPGRQTESNPPDVDFPGRVDANPVQRIAGIDQLETGLVGDLVLDDGPIGPRVNQESAPDRRGHRLPGLQQRIPVRRRDREIRGDNRAERLERVRGKSNCRTSDSRSSFRWSFAWAAFARREALAPILRLDRLEPLSEEGHVHGIAARDLLDKERFEVEPGRPFVERRIERVEEPEHILALDQDKFSEVRPAPFLEIRLVDLPLAFQRF